MTCLGIAYNTPTKPMQHMSHSGARGESRHQTISLMMTSSYLCVCMCVCMMCACAECFCQLPSPLIVWSTGMYCDPTRQTAIRTLSRWHVHVILLHTAVVSIGQAPMGITPSPPQTTHASCQRNKPDDGADRSIDGFDRSGAHVPLGTCEFSVDTMLTKAGGQNASFNLSTGAGHVTVAACRLEPQPRYIYIYHTTAVLLLFQMSTLTSYFCVFSVDACYLFRSVYFGFKAFFVLSFFFLLFSSWGCTAVVGLRQAYCSRRETE